MRERDERGDAPCPRCGLPAALVCVSHPVCATELVLVEVWWCMECRERYAVLTYLHDDVIQAREFRPEGVFADLPPPFGGGS